MSEIEEVRKRGEQNYEVSRKVLGDTASLADDLMDLYTVLAEIASKSPLAARDEYLTGLDFLLGSRHQLAIGTLAAMRGHLFDALKDCRLAIELCGFAGHVKRTPALAPVWLNAGQSDAAYDLYRKRFGTRQLFPAGQRVFRDLRERYDIASKLSHPSVYKMAGHNRFTSTPSSFGVEFRSFQLRADDRSEPARTFLWVVDTHFKILTVFEDVLRDAIAHDRARWKLRITTIDAKLDDHKAKWRPVCMVPARRQSPGLIWLPAARRLRI
jgi:hypothetical protein